MRKMFRSVVILVLTGIYALSYASCRDDVNNMYLEIAQYGAVWTADQHSIDSISDNISGSGICNAKGYYFNAFECQLYWQENNWKPTLHCQF
jgi:hypothetical protein